MVVRILWVRHGESLSHLLRGLGPTFLQASYQLPDPALTRQGRLLALERGRQIVHVAPRIRAIFTAASMRAIQTAHYLRLGFPQPEAVGLYVSPYLGDAPIVPENIPLLAQHPMESYAEYLQLPSYVDPLLFRSDTDPDVLGCHFLKARERIFETFISEGYLSMGETMVVVTHSSNLLQAFGTQTDNLDVVEEWVQLDHLGRAISLQVRLYPWSPSVHLSNNNANTVPDTGSTRAFPSADRSNRKRSCPVPATTCTS